MRRAGRWLCAWLWACASAVQAQTLGDIDVRAQGELSVVRIRFNASVSFVGLQRAGNGELYTLRFEFVAADEAVLRQATDEIRRVPAGEGLPELVVAYAPSPVGTIKQLTLRLTRPLALEARQGPNTRSLELLVRASAQAPGAASAASAAPALPAGPAATAAAATPQVEAEAATLLAAARAALDARQAEGAVAQLGQLLKLPPNSLSMTAQELIGTAWEAADNPQRARAEYALYLRLYPQAEGAARVAARLAALGGAPVAAAPGPAASAPAASRFNGSVAQYYYGGKAKSKSLVNIATGIDQATLSRTNESSLVTSVDLGARLSSDWGETRGVVRGSGAVNLQTSGHNSNSISAAYAEQRFSADGIAVRAGRQSPLSGGLLGLFDGVSMVLPLGGGYRLDVMGGVPASALVSAPSERLFAAVIEADSLLERVSGSLSLLDQATQGISNRRAVGGELRYAGEHWSLNALADYDILFKALNALALHASVQLPEQTTLTMLVDERRAPSLQLTNALISSGAVSLKTLLQTRSLAQIKDDAIATSATARQFLVSVSRPLGPRWQGSTDLRYSAIGALPAVGDFEATAATGGQFSWGLQLTGNNLYSERDVNNFNLSVIKTPFFRGVQVAYNNLSVMPGNADLTFEPSIRLYTQSDKQDVRIDRVGPGLRSSWRLTPRSSVMGELLYEISRTRGPVNRDNSSSVFFYVGYRHEFF